MKQCVLWINNIESWTCGSWWFDSGFDEGSDGNRDLNSGLDGECEWNFENSFNLFDLKV